MGQDADPVEITKAGLAYAKEKGFDTVIVDTAGRQVVDDTLMEELKNMQVCVFGDAQGCLTLSTYPEPFRFIRWYVRVNIDKRAVSGKALLRSIWRLGTLED